MVNNHFYTILYLALCLLDFWLRFFFFLVERWGSAASLLFVVSVIECGLGSSLPLLLLQFEFEESFDFFSFFLAGVSCVIFNFPISWSLGIRKIAMVCLYHLVTQSLSAITFEPDRNRAEQSEYSPVGLTYHLLRCENIWYDIVW